MWNDYWDNYEWLGDLKKWDLIRFGVYVEIFIEEGMIEMWFKEGLKLRSRGVLY